MNTKLIAAMVRYVELYKLSIIPMSCEKVPLIKWAAYQDRLPTEDEYLAWPLENIAIVTGAISNLVVVDCESLEDATWFAENRAKSPVVVKTRRGYHFYFRHPGGRVMNAQRVDGRYDVRGDGGYVLAPPSKHCEGEYSWHKPMIATADLPVFKPEWRPTKGEGAWSERRIHDAQRYIEKIHAVSGSNGHKETYRAAVILRDGGLSEAEALAAIEEWNETNADPPWTRKELLHKIRSVYL